jgi:hypothetical protein
MNPRMFLYEMDGIMSLMMLGDVKDWRGKSIPWSKVEGVLLLLGSMGALTSWISPLLIQSSHDNTVFLEWVAFWFYFCNYLLTLSGMYLLLMIPYFVYTSQPENITVFGSVTVLPFLSVILRIQFMLSPPYNTAHYTFCFVAFLMLLVALGFYMTWLMRNRANLYATEIAKFLHVKRHFLSNGCIWVPNQQYPAGYIDPGLLPTTKAATNNRTNGKSIDV